ncbi:hypothetical protein OO013_00805 [Mangrovivirga sp. M17]|uniref:Uncharacterized protein n=1 Tax=Mangrovivirga halotolerans TaxID=2993936 RepID=A0ABT3RKN3_9BACT|nr:hypothetical protein [Mangrovivirga halotolerans]MCX2742379.1 hypothetical protein [Mangrovivirga halotolerans]
MRKVFFSLLLILASFNASLSFNSSNDPIEYKIIDQGDDIFSLEIDLTNKQEGLKYQLFEGEMPDFEIIKKGIVTNDKLIISDLDKNKEYVVKFFQSDGTSFHTGLIQFYNGQ